MEELLDLVKVKGAELLVNWGPRVLVALVILVVGWRMVKVVVRLLDKVMVRSKQEETLRKFIGNMANWGLKSILIISVAGMIGIETTSFVALIGAAGLAIGMALQGALANFAGGILLLIFKPYRIGDLIESKDQMGIVREIQIFNTIMVDLDNRRIIMPNGDVMSGHIKNYTAEGYVRVVIKVAVAYDSDLRKAREVLMDMMGKEPRLINEKHPPFMRVDELADSGVNLQLHGYTKPENFFEVTWDLNERALLTLRSNGVEIPFPQLDVHMK